MTRLFAKIILYLCRLISGVQMEMKDADSINGTLIFYANHSSHLDAMVILSLLPEEIRKNTFIVGSKNTGKLIPYANIFQTACLRQ